MIFPERDPSLICVRLCFSSVLRSRGPALSCCLRVAPLSFPPPGGPAGAELTNRAILRKDTNEAALAVLGGRLLLQLLIATCC